MSVNENDVKKRLDLYVSEASGSTRSGAQVLIDNGCVLVNGKEESKNYRLRLGDTVEINLPEPKEPQPRWMTSPFLKLKNKLKICYHY